MNQPMLFEQFNEAIEMCDEQERENIVNLFKAVEEKLKEASVLHASAIQYLKTKLNQNGGENRRIDRGLSSDLQSEA